MFLFVTVNNRNKALVDFNKTKLLNYFRGNKYFFYEIAMFAETQTTMTKLAIQCGN